MLLPTVLVLRDLCFLVYGGSLVAFTITLWAARADLIPDLSLQHAVRAYRSWGPGLGLSLGLTIFFLLLAHWLQQGAFVWPTHTASDRLAFAGWLTFFALWVSNLRLEVWTLDPIRKLDTHTVPFDAAAFHRACGPLIRHMGLHTLLILASAALFSLVGHLS